MIILARLVALHGLMVLVHAQTSPSGSSSAQASSTSDTPDPMVCITGSVEEGNCLSAQSNLVVNTLSPAGGPLDGNTRVIVIGHGFRNFGSLMRCRFGSREVPSRLYVAPGTVAQLDGRIEVRCQRAAGKEAAHHTSPGNARRHSRELASFARAQSLRQT